MPSGIVYIMASKRNGTRYTGVTSDTRLVWHQERPLYLDAIQRETGIKRWNRAWKIALIEKHNPEWHELFETLF
jgi:putative endonuclease